MKKVSILSLGESIGSSVTGPADIFGEAGVLWNEIHERRPEPFFQVEILTVDGKPMRCNTTTIHADRAMDDVKKTDLILISSGVTENLERFQNNVIPWLRKMHAKGSTIASICTGAFVLAETGLLDGREATTHWGYAELFRSRYPAVNLKAERLITDEGSVLCSGGANSFSDLSLYLVERFCGSEVAHQCARSLVLDMGRDNQTRFSVFDFQKSHGDSAALKAQRYLEAHYRESVSLADLAEVVAMSERNLKRRFKKATGDTPLSYQHRVRIETAKKKLERFGKGVEEVGHEVGFSDTGRFREVFRRHTGMTPANYRQRFVSERN